MVFINDSLSVALIGDWNKLYIQPNWMAENVFEHEEIEIGVNGQGAEFTISYRCDDVTIVPEQSKIIFSISHNNREQMEYMSRCINNFLANAYTPTLFAYGINCDFIDDDASSFADILDSMSDTVPLVDNGYVIISTKIIRTIAKNGKLLNMDSSIESSNIKIRFNEHHGNPEGFPTFSIDVLQTFINECTEIVRGLGYELEGDAE